jgi:hypothetical protein
MFRLDVGVVFLEISTIRQSKERLTEICSMYFALVPKTVTPSSSMVSHIDSGLFRGDPSYMTTVAPVARAETRYWNIIHPLFVSYIVGRSLGNLRGGIVEVDITSSEVTCNMTFAKRVNEHSSLTMLGYQRLLC